ncbi:MAG: tetratricopeptide (TPR) repeat protein [Candidatus Azotimanducaceae bacterium]
MRGQNPLENSGQQVIIGILILKTSAFMPSNSDKLRQQISAALETGAHQKGLQLLQAYCTQYPDDAESHYQLGVIEEQLGSAAGARKAYLRCLALSPENPLAYLYAGYCLQQQGDHEAAINLYSLASELDEGILYLWQSEQHPPETRQRSAAANQALRTHLSALHRRAVGDRRDCSRVASAIWTRTHDSRYEFQALRQQPQLFYLPELPATPFIDPQALSWTDQLQSYAGEIQEELLGALPLIREKGRPYLPEGTPLDEAFAPLVGSLNWTALDLYVDGIINSDLSSYFPKLFSALETIPLYGLGDTPFEVFFSLLRPGQHIKPHFGESNHSLTVHLPIVLPDDCWLRVGGETCRWQPGEITIFDDTFDHEACNESAQERIVLIFSIWHPDLSDAEQQAIQRSFVARKHWLAQRQLPKTD